MLIVPPPPTHKRSLRDSMKRPVWTESDFGKIDRSPQLHLGFQALALWAQRHKGKWPLPYDHVPTRSSFQKEEEDQTVWQRLTKPGPAGARVSGRRDSPGT